MPAAAAASPTAGGAQAPGAQEQLGLASVVAESLCCPVCSEARAADTETCMTACMSRLRVRRPRKVLLLWDLLERDSSVMRARGTRQAESRR